MKIQDNIIGKSGMFRNIGDKHPRLGIVVEDHPTAVIVETADKTRVCVSKEKLYGLK